MKKKLTLTIDEDIKKYADKLLQSVEGGAVTGIVSAESFSNLYYVIRKLSSHENAIHLLKELRTIVTVGILIPEVVESALNSGWKGGRNFIVK